MDARPPHPFSHRPPLHAQSNSHPPPSPPQHPLAPPPHFGGYAPATSQPQPQPQPPIHMPFSADPYPSARRDPFFPHAAAQHAHHVSAPEHAPAGDRQFGWGGTGTLDSSLKTPLGALPHEPLRCIGSCRLSKTVVGLVAWAPGGQAAAGVEYTARGDLWPGNTAPVAVPRDSRSVPWLRQQNHVRVLVCLPPRIAKSIPIIDLAGTLSEPSPVTRRML